MRMILNYLREWRLFLSSFVFLLVFSGCAHNPPLKIPTGWNTSNLARLEVNNPETFSFAVMGDNRGGECVFGKILQDITRDPCISFVIDLGDTVQRADERKFYRFFKQVQEHLTIPLLVAPGNHELKGNRWLYRSVLGIRYFSFRTGNTAFFVLSSTSCSGIDQEQERWLEKELGRYRKLKYRLVFMHYPLFDPRGSHFRHCLSGKAAASLLKIFKKYNVTCVFAGHIHGYFRGNWDGVPFVVSGGGGARLAGYDPEHYFFHYLKVTVEGSHLKIKVCKVLPPNNCRKSGEKITSRAFFSLAPSPPVCLPAIWQKEPF